MLTKRQLDLLRLIDSRIKRNGIPPSFEEMKDAMGLKSKSGVHRLINALVERKHLRRLPNRARALEVLKLPEQQTNATADAFAAAASSAANDQRHMLEDMFDTILVPVMGRIAAGSPIEAISQKEREINVPSYILSGIGEHFALTVSGDSMIGAGILDSDVVLIRKQHTADNGEIIVALVKDEEVTLKRLRKKGSSIALEAANPDHETRVYRPNEIAVQGKLVGLLRSY
ncbi:MAG: transcriptional repressor LexA [Rhodobacteraceae bacterium]|nr:transcriptional repressor LexA [Paracoccaceae bacterium]